jgi:hypothetical protein
MAQVEVKPSPLHGRGVFAVQDIKAGDCVCAFAGQKKQRREVTRTEMDYVYDLEAGEEFDVGFIVPKTKLGVGQLINDVACPKLDVKTEGRSLEVQLHDLAEATIAYTKMSRQHNVMCDEKKYYATTDIKAGTELVTWYGVEVWLNHFILKGTLDQQVALTLFEAAYKVEREKVLFLVLSTVEKYKLENANMAQPANMMLCMALQKVKWDEYTDPKTITQLRIRLQDTFSPSERMRCGW